MPKELNVQDNNRIMIGRNDTILGICEAIGTDFGFHPNWLRIALASCLLFAPTAVIGTYLGLGVAVAASRFFFPNRTAAAPTLVASNEPEAPIVSEPTPLPVAA